MVVIPQIKKAPADRDTAPLPTPIPRGDPRYVSDECMLIWSREMHNILTFSWEAIAVASSVDLALERVIVVLRWLLALSLPRLTNFKFPLQPRQYITQPYEEHGFSEVTQMKDNLYYQFSPYLTYTFLLKRLGECTFLNMGVKGCHRIKSRCEFRADVVISYNELPPSTHLTLD